MDIYKCKICGGSLEVEQGTTVGFCSSCGTRQSLSSFEDEQKNTGLVSETADSTTPETKPLLERIFLFLEDGHWEGAGTYCEKVLDRDPQNALAYLGKLMAELQIRRREDLNSYQKPLGNNSNYQRAVRFGGDQMDDLVRINARNEKAALDVYQDTVVAMKSATTEKEFSSVAMKLKSISGFKDADSLVSECAEKMLGLGFRDDVYASAKRYMSLGTQKGYKLAVNSFKMIPGWRDADQLIVVCQKKIGRSDTIQGVFCLVIFVILVILLAALFG